MVGTTAIELTSMTDPLVSNERQRNLTHSLLFANSSLQQPFLHVRLVGSQDTWIGNVEKVVWEIRGQTQDVCRARSNGQCISLVLYLLLRVISRRTNVSGTHYTIWYKNISVCTSASSAFAAKFQVMCIYVLQTYVFLRPVQTRPSPTTTKHLTWFFCLSLFYAHFFQLLFLWKSVVVTEKVPLFQVKYQVATQLHTYWSAHWSGINL